ncbi:CgeB family protein [Aeribacillus sp. SP014]
MIAKARNLFVRKILNNYRKNLTDIMPNFKTEFFKIENWNYKKNGAQIYLKENELVINKTGNGLSYFSFLEKNKNYNFIPSNSKRIMLKNNFLVKISGRTTSSVKALIYLIEYDNFTRINTHKIPLNKEVEVVINPKSKYLRVAIRLFGKGTVKITNVEIVEDYIFKNFSKKMKSKARKINEIKVACILDEFSMSCFSDIISLIPFSPDNWREVLTENKPDFLLVESAWRGNFGSWEYQVGKYNNNQNNLKLKRLIKFCKNCGIPTVFWNKEDPIHFEKFIETAKLFDYVLTTDANMIPKYRNYVGHSRVYAMQFAANPAHHNPTSANKQKRNNISFAGSYYANRHEDRRRDMDMMLSVTKKFGLDIYDRNYERNKNGNSHFQFPEQFQDNIVGTLKYKDIDIAYKEYKLILNVNSVKYSPTMFSRRVFEGLACGTPIISSYSIGIKKTFKNVVLMSEDKEELIKNIEEILNNEKKYRELSMEGIRSVYRKHTYFHRIKFILDLLNIEYDDNNQSITLVIPVSSLSEFNEALAVFEEQSYENKKLLIFIRKFEGYEQLLNKYNNSVITTMIHDYVFNYESISDIISTDYFTIMDTNNSYGKYYIEDLMYASIYSGADIIGKRVLFKDSYEVENYEYQYVDYVIPDTALFKTDIAKFYNIKDILYNREYVISELFKKYGAKIYSSDKFNFKIGEKNSSI